MYDLTITAEDVWTDPVRFKKGDLISISIKGTWTGNVQVRRWFAGYGETVADNADSLVHAGVIQSYDEPFEGNDTSGGDYYYQIGSAVGFTGTALVHMM